MKIRKTLKVGDKFRILYRGRSTVASEEYLTILRVLKAGDEVDGYGHVQEGGYEVEGSRTPHFETVNGHPEYVRGVILFSNEFSEIEYYNE